MPTADEYFRRDQERGITGPDLSKTCTLAEHVVQARGKRTQFTSVSRDRESIRDFGETLYRLLVQPLLADRHMLLEHDDLVRRLFQVIREASGKEKDLALRAIRRVRKRKEGLVEWHFDSGGVERKDLIHWATEKVREFFVRV